MSRYFKDTVYKQVAEITEVNGRYLARIIAVMDGKKIWKFRRTFDTYHGARVAIGRRGYEWEEVHP